MSELGFFGGRKLDLLEEYKSPKLNILEEFKRVINGYPPDKDAIVPILNWCSNHIMNIKASTILDIVILFARLRFFRNQVVFICIRHLRL